MSSTTRMLAVYGSLKSGFGAHWHLKGANQRGSCWVKNFGLASEGSYPSAFHFPGKTLWVEVYDITDAMLASCDKLEGIDSGYYTRIEVDTYYGKAFMYVMPKKMMTPATRWFPSGIWDQRTHHCVPWMGWKDEIRLHKEAEERRRIIEGRHADEDGFDPEGGPYHNEDDEEDVPLLVLVEDEAKAEADKPRHSGQMEKVWNPKIQDWEYVPYAFGTPHSCPIIGPTKPRELSKYEKAKAIINEGMKTYPDLPKEEVA